MQPPAKLFPLNWLDLSGLENKMRLVAASPPRMVTLVILAGLSALALNMFLPSLANMAADFQVDYALITLSIAGFLGITAVLMLVIGPLSDRYGRRPVMLSGLVIFTLASIVCALTEDIWVFLVFRVVQGAVIAGWTLPMAIIRDTSPPSEAASRIGYVAMAMAVAPMTGPMIGGLLDEVFGWRASFYTFAILGAVTFCLCWVDLGETNTKRSATMADQFREYPALLRSVPFWGYALCMAFSTGAFYAFLAGAPQVTESVFGLSPALLGVCLGSITVGFAFGSFLSGQFGKRYGLTTMMIAGRLVGATGMVAGLAAYSFGIVHAAVLFASVILVGMGNGLTIPSCNAGAMSARPDLAGSASGLAGALAVGVGSLVTLAVGLIVTETTGVYALFGMMLSCILISLAAALMARRQEEAVASLA